MAVRVKLNDGSQVIAYLSFEDMHKAYQKALDRNTTLDIKQNGEIKRAVSPMQILYFEPVDEATVAELLDDEREGADPRPARILLSRRWSTWRQSNAECGYR